MYIIYVYKKEKKLITTLSDKWEDYGKSFLLAYPQPPPQPVSPSNPPALLLHLDVLLLILWHLCFKGVDGNIIVEITSSAADLGGMMEDLSSKGIRSLWVRAPLAWTTTSFRKTWNWNWNKPSPAKQSPTYNLIDFRWMAEDTPCRANTKIDWKFPNTRFKLQNGSPTGGVSTLRKIPI